MISKERISTQGWLQWEGTLACPACRSVSLQVSIGQVDFCGLVEGYYFCSDCGKQYLIQAGVHNFITNSTVREAQGGEIWKAEEFSNLLPDSGIYKTHAEWLEKKLGYSPTVAAEVSAYESRSTKGLMLNLIRSEQPQSVLDLGCGVGYLTFELLSSSAEHMRVACVDVLPAHVGYVRIRQVEEGWPSVLPVLGDAERLPFADNSINVLMGSEVLEHVPDPTACAKEIMRILAPGGLAVLSTPNQVPYENYNKTRLAIRHLFRMGPGPGEDFFDNPLKHENLVDIFTAAGFQIEKVMFGIKVPMSKRFFMYLPMPVARHLVNFLEKILSGKRFGVSVLVACRKPIKSDLKRSMLENDSK